MKLKSKAARPVKRPDPTSRDRRANPARKRAATLGQKPALTHESKLPTQSDFTPDERAFLNRLNVDLKDLPEAAYAPLAELLKSVTEQSAQLPAHPTGMRQAATMLTAQSQDASLTLTKSIDLAAGHLTVELHFRHKEAQYAWHTTLDTMRVRPLGQMAEQHPPQSQSDTLQSAKSEFGQEVEESVQAFMRGALLGDFNEDSSISAIAGQTLIGFIPIVGQIADARDLAAAVKRAKDGEPGALMDVAIATIGFVPGMDWLKGSRKAAMRSITEAKAPLAKAVPNKSTIESRKLARRKKPVLTEEQQNIWNEQQKAKTRARSRRGRSSETNTLNNLDLPENRKKFKTASGNTVPDAVDYRSNAMSGHYFDGHTKEIFEIKDKDYLTLSQQNGQLRKQIEAVRSGQADGLTLIISNRTVLAKSLLRELRDIGALIISSDHFLRNPVRMD